MNMTYLYLHGFASGPGSSKARFFAGRFAELGLRLEVPDLAEGDFRGLTIGGQLRLIGRLMAGRPSVLIGSSMGGYVAALRAARSPEVQRVVLMAPAFGFARRWPERMGVGRMEQWKRDGVMRVFHFAEGAEREIGYGLIGEGLTYEDFPEVGQPALVFHGVDDDVVPVEYSRRFAEGRGNVTLREVDSGHELLNVLEFLWRDTAAFLRLAGG